VAGSKQEERDNHSHAPYLDEEELFVHFGQQDLKTSFVFNFSKNRNMSHEKVKILVCGPVLGQFHALRDKLASLQSSKAGPFDVCFCVGPFFDSSGNEDKKETAVQLLGENGNEKTAGVSAQAPTLKFPFPVYFTDTGRIPEGVHLNSSTSNTQQLESSPLDQAEATFRKNVCKHATNLYQFTGAADIITLPIGSDFTESNKNGKSLVVAFLPPHSHTDTPSTKPFVDKTSHVSYMGCDLLLSSEWGQGMLKTNQQVQQGFFTAEDNERLLSNNGTNKKKLSQMGSYDVAELATQARPRYHFVPSIVQQQAAGKASTRSRSFYPYATALPYKNLPSSSAPNGHACRFIAMANVVPKLEESKWKTKDEKRAHKFMHAIGAQSLIFMSPSQLHESTSNLNLLPCPYGKDNTIGTSLNESKARHLLAEEQAEAASDALHGGGGGGDQFRWAGRGIHNLAGAVVTNNPHKRPHPSSSSSSAQNHYGPAGTSADNVAVNDSQAKQMQNKCLFVHGLDQATQYGFEMNQCVLLEAFAKYKCTKVRIPKRKSHSSRAVAASSTNNFAFVEFEAHEQAQACLDALPSRQLSLNVGSGSAVVLSLKWSSMGSVATYGASTEMRNDPQQVPLGKRKRLTEQEAQDSETLFCKLPSMSLPAFTESAAVPISTATLETTTTSPPPLTTTPEKEDEKKTEQKTEAGNASAPPPNNDCIKEEKKEEGDGKEDASNLYLQMLNTVKRVVEYSLEEAVNEGVTDPSQRATVADEPALSVSVRHPALNKNYGFLVFASHAAANMAVAALTDCQDGGNVKDDIWSKALGSYENVSVCCDHVAPMTGVQLYWASGTKESEKEMEEAGRKKRKIGGHSFPFQQHHFPPDSRTDCWFCLASPTCERHLIVAVKDSCYVAMPKGAMNSYHSLIVPVEHNSRGALLGSAAPEMETTKEQLKQHAREEVDSELFVFERAIQTKGGYHTHVQCIPVKSEYVSNLIGSLMKLASQAGFSLKEVNTGLSVTALINNAQEDDAGDSKNSGYFYAEVPVGRGMDARRFLFVASGNGGVRSPVPIQFGRYVAADATQEPQKAEWKACLVSQEEETASATAFRECVTKYIAE
jgi:hypothetical protein